MNTELTDTVLRNPPWYHVTGAEEFEFGRRFFYQRDSHFGVMVLIQTQSLEAHTEFVTPASLSWRSRDDDSEILPGAQCSNSNRKANW